MALTILIGLLSFLPSCNHEDSGIEDELVERKDIPLTRSQADFVKNNQHFAYELFRHISESEDEKDKSFIVSPLSVTIALGMVTNGAMGETRKEINNTLGYEDESLDDLNGFCKTILTESAGVDPSIAVEFADMALINSCWVQLKEGFSKFIEDTYLANVVYKDFQKDDITSYVNKWCDDKTHGLIKDFLKGNPSPFDCAHFLNAAYFKGIWSSRFNSKNTKKKPFTLEGGDKKDVKTMNQKANFDYYEIPQKASAVCLPYGNKAYSMTVILPNEDVSLKDLVSSMDSGLWQEIVANKSLRVVDLTLPSFESEYGTAGIRNILIDMGIVKAFDPMTADFTEMTKNSAYIQDVLHKARIIVDEKGSEAAAVTDVYMAVTSSSGGPATPPPTLPEIKFHADRPFLYVISEVSTGAIFFIGQYTGK